MQIYRRLNRKYFRNKIKVSVKFSDLTSEGCIGLYCHGEIEIDKSLRKIGVNTVELTLLHEMVHAELGERRLETHGNVFNQRIHRLYKKGAYKKLL